MTREDKSNRCADARDWAKTFAPRGDTEKAKRQMDFFRAARILGIVQGAISIFPDLFQHQEERKRNLELSYITGRESPSPVNLSGPGVVPFPPASGTSQPRPATPLGASVLPARLYVLWLS